MVQAVRRSEDKSASLAFARSARGVAFVSSVLGNFLAGKQNDSLPLPLLPRFGGAPFVGVEPFEQVGG